MRDADVLLKERGPLSDRHLDGIELAGRLVRGIAHLDVGIPLPQKVDLVQLKAGLGGPDTPRRSA